MTIRAAAQEFSDIQPQTWTYSVGSPGSQARYTDESPLTNCAFHCMSVNFYKCHLNKVVFKTRSLCHSEKEMAVSGKLIKNLPLLERE